MTTVVKQLEEAQSRIAELEAEVEQSGKTLEAKEAEHAKALESMQGERDAVQADLKTAQEELAKAPEVLKAAEDALKTEQEAHTATKAELEKARKGLANPAFAEAAVAGMPAGTDEGGTAAAEEPLTKAEALAAYKKIEDAKERKAFRKEHAEVLGL